MPILRLISPSIRPSAESKDPRYTILDFAEISDPSGRRTGDTTLIVSKSNLSQFSYSPYSAPMLENIRIYACIKDDSSSISNESSAYKSSWISKFDECCTFCLCISRFASWTITVITMLKRNVKEDILDKFENAENVCSNLDLLLLRRSACSNISHESYH